LLLSAATSCSTRLWRIQHGVEKSLAVRSDEHHNLMLIAHPASPFTGAISCRQT
jgi:hypothetical protein